MLRIRSGAGYRQEYYGTRRLRWEFFFTA